MAENASNSFSRKGEKNMLVFPKNAEKNASIIEKGLTGSPSSRLLLFFVLCFFFLFRTTDPKSVNEGEKRVMALVSLASRSTD